MAINTVEKEEKNTEEDCRDPINLQTKPCVDMLYIMYIIHLDLKSVFNHEGGTKLLIFTAQNKAI